MTTPRLQLRVPSLDNVPQFLRQCYAPDPKGGFTLQVDGVGAAAPPAAPPPSGKARTSAEDLREKAIERIVARVAPRPEQRDAVAAALRPLIRIDGTADEPELAFLSGPNSWRLPSSAIGRDWADEHDFVAHVLSNGIVKAEHLPDAPPPPKTPEQAARDDSEPWQAKPKNIRVRSSCSQREFEDAFHEAKRRGGEVIIDETLPPAPPTLRFNPAKDVPIAANGSQEDFVAAMKLARSRGGEVIIMDEPAEAE